MFARYRSLLAVLALHVIAGILYAATAPLLEVSDEPRHYAYVEHLARGGGGAGCGCRGSYWRVSWRPGCSTPPSRRYITR